MTRIFTFQLDLDFNLINRLSSIDRFGGEWSSIERREGNQSLKHLKSIATVQSVGASTRIEGSKMTNDEVKALIFDNIKVEKLVERDQQEVVGYFNALDIIFESYQDIEITENSIKNLHNILMKYSEKDQWHKGNYKQFSNSVEATNPDGSKTIIFETTPPGVETEDAMRSLIEWHNSDKATPSIIKSAVFVYDFLSIHPFQDGNGRLSRLLGTLLLLKHHSSWIQYVSFEHEIENRKTEYYHVLMDCQKNRPGENVYPWIMFFLDCLGNIQNNLMKKLDVQKSEHYLSPREKMIYSFVDNHPGCKSGEIAAKLNIPLPTVKRILSEMVAGKFLMKHGTGAGTNYTTEKLQQVRTDRVVTFTDKEISKEFILKNKHSFIEIKKIILTPKFQWVKPDDWARVLLKQGLQLVVTCHNNRGDMRKQPYSIIAFNNPHYFQPVFTLNNPIHIPISLWEGTPQINEFPISVLLELKTEGKLEFDVMLVYDWKIR
ncbi:MAG: Fic family protein [Cytophagaceae bacterium]|nr:Fic family protein [Cytophagaceae bacterium]